MHAADVLVFIRVKPDGNSKRPKIADTSRAESAFRLAELRAGIKSDARIPITATVTRSSIKVKAVRGVSGDEVAKAPFLAFDSIDQVA